MADVSFVSSTPKDLTLGTHQVLIVGQQTAINAVAFDVIKSKLSPDVTEESFLAAKKLFNPQSDDDKTIPLFFKSAYLIQVSSRCSRNNSSFAPHSLTKLVRDATDGQKVNIVLICPKNHLYGSVCAVAKAFPSFSRKTRDNSNPKKVVIEAFSVGENNDVSPTVLSELDIKCLNDVIKGVRQTASIVDCPANEMHVSAFVDLAVNVAKELPDVKCLVIRGDELRDQGFGGIYSVGKCSLHPPAMVVLSWKPKKSTETFALVGKGIVYDTGGLSMKTKTLMPGMKRDCGGAAAVMNAFSCLVSAGFDQELHAVLCLAENMVGPMATRPDDVITMLSGKTVEVNNTDAEGRLVLGDGVFYAHSVLKATVIVDMATLTGAQHTATGKHHAALITNNEIWEQKAVKAGKTSGDLVFPMIYCPELHWHEFKSAIADMKNANLGGPQVPSSLAALFIHAQIEFDTKNTWIHFDISAPAREGERATGYGVALLAGLFAEHLKPEIVKCLAL